MAKRGLKVCTSRFPWQPFWISKFWHHKLPLWPWKIVHVRFRYRYNRSKNGGVVSKRKKRPRLPACVSETACMCLFSNYSMMMHEDDLSTLVGQHNLVYLWVLAIDTLSEQTRPYSKGHRRNVRSHGIKCTELCCTTPYTVWQCGENYFQLAAMFDHMTTLFLNKPMVYGVVQQVYGLVVRTAW